jgi:hypothetical protein
VLLKVEVVGVTESVTEYTVRSTVVSSTVRYHLSAHLLYSSTV